MQVSRSFAAASVPVAGALLSLCAREWQAPPLTTRLPPKPATTHGKAMTNATMATTGTTRHGTVASSTNPTATEKS